MTEPRLEDAFDECLTRLAVGDSAEDCLRAYPDLAAELRPMLAAVQQARSVSRVPHHVQMRSRARFLAAAAERRPGSGRAPVLAGLLRRALTTAVTVLAGFILGSTGLYYASADTVPGETLYGLKRTLEETRVQLVADPGERLRLEQLYNERREVEIQEILAAGSGEPVVVNFGGPLAAHSATRWIVDDFTLRVTGATQIVGPPQSGYYVDVLAEYRDGALIALRLTVEEFEVTGILRQEGNYWTIGDADFVVTRHTTISGGLTPGAAATARIRSLHSGDRVATTLTILPPAAPALLPPTRIPTSTLVPTSRPQPARYPATVPTSGHAW